LAVAHLPSRTQHVYVSNVETPATATLAEEEEITYVMPKNLLRKFAHACDVRVQVGGYLYGCSPPDHPNVKEIRCMVVPPQTGTPQSLALPDRIPQHDMLEGLELLGWMHSQNTESDSLSPLDAATHASMLQRMPAMSPDHSVIVTCSLLTGSMSLAGYRLNAGGVEWGNGVSDPRNPVGYIPERMTDHAHLLLTDRVGGFFLVPDVGSWNYNFAGIKVSDAQASYGLAIGIPRPFYDDEHRAGHFTSFSPLTVSGGGGASAVTSLDDANAALGVEQMQY
jgi:pre-mRNA-processing factor 8